jgi:RNA polymerase sigma-B factor
MPTLETRAAGHPLRATTPTRATIDELWRMRDNGGRPVRDELVRRHLSLARKLASRYRNPNEPLEDLIQIASLGLVQAVDRFDPARGLPFQAFAVPTIVGELKRHFRDTGWSVHVPRDAKELALKVDRTVRTMTDKLGRSPRVDEIAQFMELDIEDVLEALETSKAHYGASLDAPAHEADEEIGTLGDSIGAVDERYAVAETRIDLVKGFRRLPYLERTALALRFGEDLKQTEIAKRMGCSQMQVSRLLSRATKRLRESQ